MVWMVYKTHLMDVVRREVASSLDAGLRGCCCLLGRVRSSLLLLNHLRLLVKSTTPRFCTHTRTPLLNGATITSTSLLSPPDLLPNTSFSCPCLYAMRVSQMVIAIKVFPATMCSKHNLASRPTSLYGNLDAQQKA